MDPVNHNFTFDQILDQGSDHHLRYMIYRKYDPTTYVSSPEFKWCIKQFGEHSRFREWDSVRGMAHSTEFYFKQQDHAIAFTLVWC